MDSFINSVIEGVLQTTYLEWIAILCSLLYLFFAIKEMIICWLFAFISSAIYAYLCFTFKLHIESFLQLFYVGMAVYGFLSWNKQNEEVPIQKWKPASHIINIVIATLLSIILAIVFKTYTDQANPYLDAFTTCFSFAATFMVAKKVLENWIYWIIIDSFLVYLYFERGLKMSSVLMIIYVFMAIKGYLTWNKQYRQQNRVAL